MYTHQYYTPSSGVVGPGSGVAWEESYPQKAQQIWVVASIAPTIIFSYHGELGGAL